MRLVTVKRDGASHSGLLVNGRVVETATLAAAAGLGPDETPATNREVVEASAGVRRRLADAARDAVARNLGLSLGAVELGAPIENPDKILCLGLNYRDHAEESGLALPTTPMLFAKFRNSLAGPRADVVPPAHAEQIDYEAELAVVVGRRAKDVPAERALDHVFGVMAFNDITARDVQHATSQWTAGKAIDTFAPCGPALVTLDEIGDLDAIRLCTRVNGETVQDGSTADMIFDIPRTIEYVSALMTLEPGDIIATGTPAGVGVSRNPQLLLGAGDVVEVEVEGVGVLRNTVVPARVPVSA